jgi:hypothetical protein
LLHDRIRGLAAEDFTAQRVDAAAARGVIERLPAGLGTGFLIGESITRELGIEQVVLIHEDGGNRDAFGERLLAAVHDHAADGRQLFDAVEGLARAFRIAVAVHQLDLNQPARKHAEPDHQDRAQNDAAVLKRGLHGLGSGGCDTPPDRRGGIDLFNDGEEIGRRDDPFSSSCLRMTKRLRS